MKIAWLLIALSIAALSYIFMAKDSAVPGWVLWVYAWIPGALGLLWSRYDKVNIPVFPRNKLYFLLSLLGGLAIGALSFFIDQRFFVTSGKIASIQLAVFYFFLYYVTFLFLFFLLFIGGEICWRGYLWERWKNCPLRGGVGIWLLWCAWSAPISIAFSKSLLSMAFLNFSLMVPLHFFRKESKSIGTGTLFYASLCASSIYFQILFSSSPDYLLATSTNGTVLLLISLILILVKQNRKNENHHKNK